MGLYLHLIANAEIEIHDGEAAGQGVHIRGYLRIDTMDARESKVLLGLGLEFGVWRFHLAVRHILPAAQSEAVVEEEMARALATAHHQTCHFTAAGVVEGSQGCIAQDIDIVDKDGVAVGMKEGEGFAQTATRIKEFVTLVGDAHINFKRMAGQIFLNHWREVVDVHHYLLEAFCDEPFQGDGQKGPTFNFNQSLRAMVGERFEPRT